MIGEEDGNPIIRPFSHPTPPKAWAYPIAWPKGPSMHHAITAPAPSPSAGSPGDAISPLIPAEYSWFKILNHICQHSLGVWRGIPIPGTFFPNDFNFGVKVGDQRWSMRGQADHCQWQWDQFVLPFLNSVNRFKFLVDLNWINQQAAMGIDNAPAKVRQLHADYIEKKFPGGVNPSANELNGLFGRKPKSPTLIKEAGTKYVLLSLWRHHVSEEGKRVKREANTVAYEMSLLQVDEYPLAPPPPPPPLPSTGPTRPLILPPHLP
jgi:hypothetical protein